MYFSRGYSSTVNAGHFKWMRGWRWIPIHLPFSPSSLFFTILQTFYLSRAFIIWVLVSYHPLLTVYILFRTFDPKLPGKPIHTQVYFPYGDEIGFFSSKNNFGLGFAQFCWANFIKNPPYWKLIILKAPILFYVNSHFWYLRLPRSYKYYMSVIIPYDPNHIPWLVICFPTRALSVALAKLM